MRLHRRTAPALAVAVAALTIGACAPTRAGSAAIVGNTAITERALQSAVTAYLDSLPPAERAAKRSSMAEVQSSVLGSLVDEAVVGQVADARGVVVTPAQVSTQVESATAGAGAQLDSQLATLYLTRASLPAFERTNLQFIGLRQALGAASLSDADAQAKVLGYVIAQAKKLPVRLSPRYGRWDPSTLSISGGVQSISTPAA